METVENPIYVSNLDKWLEVNDLEFTIGKYQPETKEQFAAYDICFRNGDLEMAFMLRVPGEIPEGMTIPTGIMLHYLLGCAVHMEKTPEEIADMFAEFGGDTETTEFDSLLEAIRDTGSRFKEVVGDKYETIRRVVWK